MLSVIYSVTPWAGAAAFAATIILANEIHGVERHSTAWRVTRQQMALGLGLFTALGCYYYRAWPLLGIALFCGVSCAFHAWKLHGERVKPNGAGRHPHYRWSAGPWADDSNIWPV